MTARMKTLVGLAICLVCFLAGWLVNGWRSDARIARVELTQTSKELQQTQQAAQKMADTQKGFDDALQAFQGTQQDNAKAQQDLGRVLLDLRSTTAGLRGDFASLPARIERANSAALGPGASQTEHASSLTRPTCSRSFLVSVLFILGPLGVASSR